MDNKLIRLVESLPSIVGVYYFHDEQGNIIYIGKSKNIKKRVNQHFTSEAAKAKQIQKEVQHISFEPTGNELIALLKENEEIKRLQPKYNRSLKRNTLLNAQVFTHALYVFTDENGYMCLKIAKADFTKEPITTFTNLARAKQTVQDIVAKYNLCQKLTGLQKSSSNENRACFYYDIQKCAGACIGKESAESYNIRVKKVIEKFSFPTQTLLVLDRGREPGEKSAFLLENGHFMGMGFFALNHQIINRNILEKIIAPMENNRDARHIIQSYMRRNDDLKIIQFE